MLDVFFIGDGMDPQFGETVAWMRNRTALREVSDLQGAIKAVLDEGLSPSVVFLAQSRRGQCDFEDVQRLIQAAPLARLVVIAGCWCEGEARSGVPVAGVHRVAWHQAPYVVPRELTTLAAGRACQWSWPFEAEQAALWAPATEQRSSGLVVILSEAAGMADSIAVALRVCGFSTVAGRPTQPISVFGAAVVIWDVPASYERAVAEWTILQSWLRGVPVVAILGFPRPDDIRRLKSIGVSAVLGKPFQVVDLAGVIQRLAAGRDEVLSWQEVAAA